MEAPDGRTQQAVVREACGADPSTAGQAPMTDAIGKEMMRATGDRLRLLQLLYGFHQSQDIARALGVRPASWSTWATGKVQLPLRVAANLKPRFGCSIDWLYLGDESNCVSAFVAKLRHAERSA